MEMDTVLVPIGLGLMVAYHSWLLYKVVKEPTMTLIGINALNRRIWVHTMMVDPSRNGILAVQTLRNNIMASTLLASTAIMLCSLMAMLMTNNNYVPCNSSRSLSSFSIESTISSSSSLLFSVKSFLILTCFLLTFLMNVQSIRYYSHASMLITIRRSPLLMPDYVATIVNRGSCFWSIGLRAFYFSLPLFLWIFGPIPMFMCSVLLVSVLHWLDVFFHGMIGEEEGEEIDEFMLK